MDLTKIQSEQLKRFIQDWSSDKRFELETTFGIRGVVDSNTFLQIAQRLRTKGFEMIPQDDRLNIITPNHIRLTLEGLAVLQDYCRDDLLQGRDFTAMFKDRAFQSRDLDIHEYHMRFKVRREEELSKEDPRVVELLRTWKAQKKAFRLIRRWSFQGKGIRMDLSMVRQTATLPETGEYDWASTFQEKSVLGEVPRYEVEVELLHDTEYTNTPEKALKALITGCGEILRAIQKNTLLIRQSVADAVRKEYQLMINSDKFRGVGPVTLQVDNIRVNPVDGVPNIRTGYNVTDKADGLRTMGFVNKQGELFLIDQSLNIYRTGLKNERSAESLVDGEWVTMSKDGTAINHYLIFDIYHFHDGKKVSNLPFVTFKEGILDRDAECRFNKMTEWFDTWQEGVEVVARGLTDANRLVIAVKKFEFGSAGNDSIFRLGCTTILDTNRIYHTDGLILTSNSEPIPDKPGVRFKQQFKWKPSKDNTVDFLINYERNIDIPTLDKVTTTIQADTNSSVQYKTMRLYVGSAKGKTYEDPRATILFQEPLSRETEVSSYKPALFHPIEFPDTMANTCYVLIQVDPETAEEYAMTEDTKEPIPNRSIVEFRYDPSREPGWRWIPARIRHDKTERLIRAIAKGGNIKYSGMMNDEGVANDVWNSIHNPVTESMIRNGTEQANQTELEHILSIRESEVGKKYYESTAPKENIILVKGMRDFHNRYIKNDILIKRALRGGNKTLVDLACGKGGDLSKWIEGRARYVVGIDASGDGITNPDDGAYKRYMNDIIKFGADRVPKAAFVIGNSSKNIVSGAAGANPEESNILRKIFGKYEADGTVPPYIDKVMTGSMRSGADVAACMFALHYFFKDKEMLDGFLRNLSEIVKIGGYFIGCCFDGDKVFKMLRYLQKGETKTGMVEDVPLWSITKQYDVDELLPEDSSLGLPIDVQFISIGSGQIEYLVPFELLTKKMKDIGFSLLDASELKDLGLNASTNTFDVSYLMAERDRQRFSMLEPVKEYSFLNRWFIFKRRGEGAVPTAEEAEALAAATEVAPAAPVAEETISIVKQPSAAVLAVPSVKKAKNKPNVGVRPAVEEEAIPPIELQVEPSKGAILPDADRAFDNIEIFRFGPDVPANNMLGLKTAGGKKDEYIGRWMSLAGRFPIPDADDESITYPTIEHFLAGMKIKHASNKPQLAKEIMSTTGSIHRAFGLKRVGKSIEPESGEDFKLLLDEITMVRKKISTKTNLNQYRLVINDAVWNSIKDKYLMEALTYRFKRDARFISGVTTARDMGKYLLYSTTASLGGSELGGVRNVTTRKILGENKVGRFVMEIGEFKF
jgi:hypothetical protein